MNNETNVNPNVEAEQMTGPATTEAVPVVPEQVVEEAPVTPVVPEMVAEVPEAPAVPEMVAAAPVEAAPAVPEMVASVPEAPAAPVAAPAAVTPAPIMAEPTPEAQPSLPAVEIPMSTVNVPAIETQPPVEVASNNFADFQMPEVPAAPTVPVEATPAAPAEAAPVADEGEIVGESKKGNKTIYIILGVIIGVIIIVGIIGFVVTKLVGSGNTPAEPVSNTPKDITCSYDNVIRTIDVHSEAVIKLDSDGNVSKIDYTHTYTASDKSALNDKHLAAIEYCATPGAETKLGKDTRCELKEGKIIITAFLDGEAGKPVDDYKTALTTQGFVCD